MTGRLSLLCALSLTLCSCSLLPKREAVFVPPRLDCGIFEAPTVAMPANPPTSRDVAEWQLWGFNWQTYAEGVLGQRVDSARCVALLRAQGLVK